MKGILFVCSFIFWNTSIAQRILELPKFQSIESHIEASIQIVKSKEFGIEIPNHEKDKDFLDWQILDDRLKLICWKKREDLDLKNVHIIIHTPNIKELVIAKRAKVSMDSKFSTKNTFSVIAKNGATIDLSNIVFNTLIIYKDAESDIKYNYVNTLINNKKPHHL